MSTLFIHGRQVYVRFRKAERIKPLVQRTGYNAVNGDIPKEAINWHKKLEAALVDGKWGFAPPVREELSCSQALDRYLDTKGAKNKPASRRQKKMVFALFINFAGDLPIYEVTEELVFAFRQSLLDQNLSQFTVASYLRALAPIFAWCVRKNYLQRSPFTSDVKLYPKARNPRPYEPSELERMYKYIKQQNAALYHQLKFLQLTGFRSREACDLQWSQILFDRKVIDYENQKRQNEEDLFPLYDELLEFLNHLPRTYSPYVFKYRDTTTLCHKVKSANNAVGNPSVLNVKTLRKNFIDNLFTNRELDITDVKELARHKDIRTTLTHYKHRNAMRLLAKLNAGKASSGSR